MGDELIEGSLILRCNCGCPYMRLVFIPEHLSEPWADISVGWLVSGGDALIDRLRRARDVILNERVYLREVLLGKETTIELRDYLNNILEIWPDF